MAAGSIENALDLARTGGIERIDAEVLLCHVLQRERVFLYTWPEKLLTPEQNAQFVQLLEQRLSGVPVAHLVGVREFWSLPLRVDGSTLIPRPDTEALVQQALLLPLPNDARVLDAGTGSGAIALALASERSGWSVLATDRLFNTAQLAQHNAQLLQLPSVTVVCAHWLAAFATAQFDLIVSNPPYIAGDDPHLLQGDLRFEPHSALVAAENGMADLRILISQAPRILKPGGWLVLEHGYQQATAVRELLAQHRFSVISSHRDLGDNDRVTLGCWQPDGDNTHER